MGEVWHGAGRASCAHSPSRWLAQPHVSSDIGDGGRLRANASPTRSGPEGSSRNELRFGSLSDLHLIPPPLGSARASRADEDFLPENQLPERAPDPADMSGAAPPPADTGSDAGSAASTV